MSYQARCGQVDRSNVKLKPGWHVKSTPILCESLWLLSCALNTSISYVERRNVQNCKNNYMERTIRKRVFVHVRTTKAQISLCIHTVWTGPPLSANRIAGYYRMFQLRAKTRIILCDCTGWCEDTHFAPARRHILAWHDLYVDVENNSSH